MTSNQLSLARFAFNIYGSLDHERVRESRSPSQKKLIYNCEREIVCLSQFRSTVDLSTPRDGSYSAPSHHVVIGGKNYLKLLVLNSDQSSVISEVSLVDLQHQTRFHSAQKLFNVNTVKCFGDNVACGLTNGGVNVFQISPNGSSRIAYKLEDHHRAVNLVDISEHDQVLFLGSQDGTVKVWDLRTYGGRPVMRLAASLHSDPVRSCEFSRHSRVRGKMTVLSVHDSGSLCKFDLRSGGTGNVLPERKWTFHTGPALSLHINPEAEYVLTGGRDRRICVWSYAESLHTTTPHTVLPTYGPVMKIRWNLTPSPGSHYSSSVPSSAAVSVSENPLTDYDFACLYLSDDPTITVYNLLRRYVPKEIVTTTSHKPVQNFLWADGTDRRLWTLTKSNVFVLYNLDTGDSGLLDITRPLSELPEVATAWHSHADLAVVVQDSHDYSLHLNCDEDVLDRSDDWDRQNSTDMGIKAPIGSLPNLSSLLYYKSQIPSPKDRPQLMRLSTGFTSNYASTFVSHASTSPYIKSPSPVPHRPGMEYGINRPALAREPSQSTQDSEVPPSTHTPASQCLKKNSGPSPYVVSVNVPIPLGDEAVFEVLANEYHIAVPDGFALADVCQMNARLAASVLRHRDCQVWRLLGVALEETEFDMEGADAEPVPNDDKTDFKSLSDHFVGSSDLGNFGSYTSNLTLTTNYGSAPRAAMSRESGIPKSNSTTSLLDTLSYSVSRSGSMLKKIYARFQGSSEDHAIVDDDNSSLPKKSISRHSSGVNIRSERFGGERNEKLHEKELADQNEKSANEKAEKGPVANINKPAPIEIASAETGAIDIRPSSLGRFPVFSASPDEDSALRRNPRVQLWHVASQDLDNENLNLLTSAASYSSSFLGSLNTRRTLKGSPKNFRGSFARKVDENKPLLERVDESSVHSEHRSELTKAIKNYTEKTLSVSDRPWDIINMLSKAVEYAMDQGDIVMCSTLILLFYDPFRAHFSRVLGNDACLECLGLYVETLRRKQLFTNAVNVVKEAPSDLKYKLSVYASKDVAMRFYCCWCNKLLVNEASKAKFGASSDNFGFWYCDECHRRQLNCVYCNEPSRGLTVVVSLKCGHRGHFGCLQEWFVFDGNVECPAGCDVEQ